jgi:putative transposase
MARPRHRTKPAATYFVTTNTWQRQTLFRDAALAGTVERTLIEYRDRGFYLLHGYVVMPDHLHVLLTPNSRTSLEKAVQLIKGGSSRQIGTLMRRAFPVWHSGFTEHQIRDGEDFDSHVRYIEMNPAKARLAGVPAEYPFSSASRKYRLDVWPVASGAEAPGDLAAPLRRG